jgi:hypothetical protein
MTLTDDEVNSLKVGVTSANAFDVRNGLAATFPVSRYDAKRFLMMSP